MREKSPDSVHCIDEDCDGEVEVELSGELTFYECECGNEWGYVRVTSEGDYCQVGIPEEVRRATQGAMDPPPKTIPLQVK